MGLFSRATYKGNANGDLPEGNRQAGLPVRADPEKEIGGYDDQPVKFLTGWSLSMGVLVSMGGFIFGYDTGMLPIFHQKMLPVAKRNSNN